jgi:hypothetical protein
MYCDDSRVTPVDSKEVIVRLPFFLFVPTKLTPLTLSGQTCLHLILQESQNLNYTFIFLLILHLRFLLHPPTLVIMLCIILCNYTDYA